MNSARPRKVLWGVGIRLLVMAVDLDLRIMKLREGFPGQLAAHESVESVAQLAHDLDVLLRHRLRAFSALGHRPEVVSEWAGSYGDASKAKSAQLALRDMPPR
jgi:hypothetical protein